MLSFTGEKKMWCEADDFDIEKHGKALIEKMHGLRTPNYKDAGYMCRNDFEAFDFYIFRNRTYQQVFKPNSGERPLVAPGLHIPHHAIEALRKLKSQDNPRLQYFRVYYKMKCETIVFTIIDLNLCDDNGKCSGYNTSGTSDHNRWGDLLDLEYWRVFGHIDDFKEFFNTEE